MKVLYIITKSNYGGAQRYVFDLATHLPKDTFSAVVALGGTGEPGAKTGMLVRKLEENGIRTILVKHFMRDMSLTRDIGVFFELLSIIRRERPDVLHVTSSKAGGIGALIGRMTRVPKIIFTSHGLAFDESWRPLWQRVLIWLATWWTMILSTKTIQITRDTATRASRMPFLKNKVVLIHNGREAPLLLPKDDARKRLCDREHVCGECWIGTIAELTPNKNLHTLIEATALIHTKGVRPHVWIISDGEERGRLEKQVRDLSLENYVHMPGYVEDASTLLKAFDIFTLPSKKEGLPYVLLEAGHASLPVVTSDIPGIQDIITNDRTGLMIETNSKKLADALEILISDKPLREKLGNALHRHVTEMFTIDRMVSLTSELYASNPSSSLSSFSRRTERS